MAGTISMGRRLLCVRLLVILVLKDVSGLKIRNKLLGKCLQVGERALGSRVSLGECSLYSPLQDWHWLPESQALSSPHTVERMAGVEVTETYPAIDETLSIPSTKSPADPTMIFFTMDYGMGWKITMLLLSSLALVLGTLILILNVYSNRKKQVLCVLKSYTPGGEMSVPGSPVPSERAPLTKYAMRLPHASPSLQRGEILIEWKDGTFTPLYEA